jgi:hypothetical protein
MSATGPEKTPTGHAISVPKPYVQPKLERYGSVSKLTQGHMGTHTEGQSGMSQKP